MLNITPIPGFASMYLIDQAGKVYSKYRNRFINWHDNGIGYKQVFLKTNEADRGKWYKVHRLVLLTFGGPPATDKHTDVNHIDGNKSNNHISNLQWVTKSENTRHAFKLGLLKPNHTYRNKTVSAETRRKQSIAKRGLSHPNWSGTWVTPEGRFLSISAAAQAHNTYVNKIRRYCKSGKYKGWYFVPKPE